MRFSCDPFGFPIIHVQDQETALAVLPFTKVQFELMWVASDVLREIFYDGWYEIALTINPRVSWQPCAEDSVCGHWLTGIHPSEARDIAAELTGAFLPTADDWLASERVLSQQRVEQQEMAQLWNLPLHAAARAIVANLYRSQDPISWADMMLLNSGILEWVMWDAPLWRERPSGFGALGSPAGTTVRAQLHGPSRYQQGHQISRINGFRAAFRLS